MTITKHKKISQVTYTYVSKKNTETDTIKNGTEIHCPNMPKADDGATASGCKLVHCNQHLKSRAENSAAKCCEANDYNKLGAKHSTAKRCEAIDYKAANRYKEQINNKLNLCKANKNNLASCRTQTNALNVKKCLQPEGGCTDNVSVKLRGSLIDLDKMRNKKVCERGVQAATRGCGGKCDRLDCLRDHKINFFKLAEDDFAERTTNFRNMRERMLNNFNQNLNIMNEQYERRKSSHFRLADKNREAMTNDQCNASRPLPPLLPCRDCQQQN